MDLPVERPLLIAIAGPNGAGKSTFYRAYLEEFDLPFVNADLIARDISSGDIYEVAFIAEMIRESYVEEKVSFIFETVFSDPVGDKVEFLERAVREGYKVILCFLGLASVPLCEQRVAMRVMQGGHDVPSKKLLERYSRSLVNLQRALKRLPHVYV